MTRYWFVRHGESVANAERWLAGHRDVGLTERGVAQATAIRSVLAELRPDRVVSSDLERAVRTAAIAWDHRLPPPRKVVEVRERNLGEWEGMTFDELQQRGHMDVLLTWDQGPPGGESHRDLARRALGWLDSLGEGDTLIFGHGGWIRTVVGLLDGVPTDQIGAFKVGNVEILSRAVEPGTWAELLARCEAVTSGE